MTDLKFTDLTAGSTGIDNDSLVCFSEYDGVSAYTSKKYTISVMRDILNVWEAEDKISFDATGTNKKLAENVTTTGNYIELNSTHLGMYSGTTEYVEMQGGGVTDYSKGWSYIDASTFGAGYGVGATDCSFNASANNANILLNGNIMIEANATGMGFFAATPVAKPTSVAVSAAGIHAALTSLGLIS